jgi:hypothetical protein
MRKIQGDLCHKLLANSMTPKLSFDSGREYTAWRGQLKEKFYELLGMESIIRNACPIQVEIEKEEQKEGYKRIRFVFESERGAFVPCYLLIPDTGKKTYPLAITLQGHSSGFHNSIAEPKTEAEKEYAMGRGAFAVQAVKNGFAALAIEQRGMGERRPSEPHQKNANMCEYEAHIALLLGRTILGERVWDVSKAIDAVTVFDKIDTKKILITGNSGGGTASYYAAAFDERIGLCVPSCSFCNYKRSIMDYFHCSCNFIPRAYEWFEMQDLSALIAPRPLTVVTGKEDKIFPIDGVRGGFEMVKKIYERANAKENCALIETPKAHYWCEDIVWTAIREQVKELGWKL